MKKIFTYILLAMLTLLPLTTSAKYIYLNPGGSNLWEQGNAKYSVYCNGSYFASSFMQKIDGLDIYYITVADDVTKVRFVRNQNTATTPGWDPKWNQSAEMTLSGDNDLYTITGWAESDGHWSKQTTYSFTVKFHNNKGWSNVYIYTWGPGTDTGDWPGKPIAKNTANGWYSYTVKAVTSTTPGIIFHNNNGSQTNDITDRNSDMCVELGSTSSNKYNITDIDCDQSFVVASVSLDKSTLSLAPGATYTLTATVSPETADNQTVSWRSSNDAVATVDNGLVAVKSTATNGQTADITVTTADGNKTATCVVTVAVPAQLVEELTFSNTELTITKGQTAELTTTISPNNASNKELSWTNSDPTVATYADGVVTAHKVGTTTITATTTDGSDKTATCVVTVKDIMHTFTINFYADMYSVAWTAPKVHFWGGTTQGTTFPGRNMTSLETEKGKGWWKYNFLNFEEAVSFILHHGGNSANTIGSDKTADLTVLENHTTGDYYMITTGDKKGQLAPFIHVTDVTLNKTATTIKKGSTENLSVTMKPDDATKTSNEWESSDENVATVVGGTVTAKNPGKTTITVTPRGSKLSATCEVTVPSTEVTIDKTTLNILLGETAKLTASANGPEATIVWSSSDETVATVTADGTIKALKEGTTTITATASDDETIKKTCAVKVYEEHTFTIKFWTNKWEEINLYTYSDVISPEEANGEWPGSTAGVTKKGNGWYEITLTKLDKDAIFILNGKEGSTSTQTSNLIVNEYKDKNNQEFTLGNKVNNKYTVIPFSHTDKVTLSQSSVTLLEGETFTLTATANGTDTRIKEWRTSDSEVATVVNGTITTLKPGVVTIRAISLDSDIQSEPCTLTVRSKVAPEITVDLTKPTREGLGDGSESTPFQVYAGKEFTFTATAEQTIEGFTTNDIYTQYKGGSETNYTGPLTCRHTVAANTAVGTTGSLDLVVYNKLNGSNGLVAGTHKTITCHYIVIADPVLELRAPKEAEKGSKIYYEVIAPEDAADNAFTFHTQYPDNYSDTHSGKSRYQFRNSFELTQNGDYKAWVKMHYDGYDWPQTPTITTTSIETFHHRNALVGQSISLSSLITKTTDALKYADAFTWTVLPTTGISVDANNKESIVLTPTAAGEYKVTLTATAKGTPSDETVPTQIYKKEITLTVKDATEGILVRVNAEAVINTTTDKWDNIEFHYWGNEGTGVPGTNITPISEGDYWYSAVLPLASDGKISFLVRVKGKEITATNQNGKYYTKNIENISESGCWIIDKDQVTDTEGADKNNYLKHLYHATEDCALYTRIVSFAAPDGEKFYSNSVSSTGETLSYYTDKDHTRKIQHHNGKDWVDVADVNTNPMYTDISQVQVTTLAADGKSVTEHKIYTDEFYISTDAVLAGAWEDFDKLTDEEKAAAQMTYFEPNSMYSDLYNYYWVQWCEAEKGISARVGNKYNNHITNTLEPNHLADDNGQLPSYANVRFGYNPKTNFINRAIIGGSQEGSDDYLTIYCPQDNYLYQEKDNENTDMHTYPQKFIDISNWCYEVDAYAKAGAEAVVKAKYNGIDQYLFGTETDADGKIKPTSKVLLREGTSEGKHHMRVIYDFKTNRITAGWMPDKQTTLTDDLTINANMMIIREADEQATQIDLSDQNYTIDGLRQLYTVLEITPENWNKNGNDHYGFFWISLPYDCYVKDIFGIEGYGTEENDKWVIQRYRGDKRAELTWKNSIPTFWANMKQTANAKMEANRGYVVRLHLNSGDFKAIGEGDKKKSILRLYFPSIQSGFTLANNESSTTVAAHECTVEARVNDDSNWNVIGVPGYQNMHISSLVPEKNGNDFVGGYMDGKTFFYYSWKWDNNKGIYEPQTKNPENGFQTTQAYMVQFAGTINWTESKYAGVMPAGMQARQRETNTPILLQMNLSTDTVVADKTYIQLVEGATADYDLNQDLGKIVNSGIPQIYSLGTVRSAKDVNGNIVNAQSRFAANNIPFENQSVALGVQAPAAGEYTFSMPDVPAGVVPTLLDTKTGATVNLAFDSYTVSLEQGTNETRFILQLNIQNTPTGNELTTQDEYRITQLGNELLISGLTEPTDVRLYDALGRLLYQGLIQHETIPVSQQGVYLVSINGTVQRVMVR